MISSSKVAIFYFSFVLVSLLVFYFSQPKYNEIYIILLFFCIFLSTLLFLIDRENEKELKNQLLKHSNIFLLGYFIVHFQFYLDLALGYQDLNNSSFVDNNGVILKSMILSFIGLICFYIGYTLSKVIKRKENLSYFKKSNTFFLVFLSYVIVLFYYYSVNPSYLAGGYNLYEQGASAKYAALALNAIVYSIFIQKIINLKILGKTPKNIFDFFKYIGYLPFFPMFIYLIGVLTSGDRGPIIVFILVYLFGYFSLTKKKLNLLPILLLIFIFGTFLTTLGEARKLQSDLSLVEKITIAMERDESEKKSLIPFTRELSSSVNALHHIVNYIPSQGDYLYGELQKNEFMLSIPLGSLIFSYEESPENRRTVNSQNYITWIIQGDYPSYGNGTSLVADLYSIFGLVSIIYGMIILGWFIRFLEITMYINRYNSLISMAFSCVMFCEILYLSRSSLLGSLKVIILVIFLLYFNKFIMSFFKK